MGDSNNQDRCQKQQMILVKVLSTCSVENGNWINWRKVVSYITKELKEQQDSESFVEADIERWIKRLEQLKTDLQSIIHIRYQSSSSSDWLYWLEYSYENLSSTSNESNI